MEARINLSDYSQATVKNCRRSDITGYIATGKSRRGNKEFVRIVIDRRYANMRGFSEGSKVEVFATIGSRNEVKKIDIVQAVDGRKTFSKYGDGRLVIQMIKAPGIVWPTEVTRLSFFLPAENGRLLAELVKETQRGDC